MSMSRSTVLVTGGSGFLGQHIVKHLMENADWVEEVRVFDVRQYKNMLGKENFMLNIAITIVKDDNIEVKLVICSSWSNKALKARNTSC